MKRGVWVIRKVKESDIAACAKVIRESFATVADTFGLTAENAPRFVAFSMTEERLHRQLLEECRPMYVLIADGSIVGYYSLQGMNDQQCELNQLCVLPAYRHAGSGEKLLKHAFGVAKELGCKQMKIGIVEENKVLRIWYESYGFVHTGTKKYDSFPFTCGFMEKNL